MAAGAHLYHPHCRCMKLSSLILPNTPENCMVQNRGSATQRQYKSVTTVVYLVMCLAECCCLHRGLAWLTAAACAVLPAVSGAAGSDSRLGFPSGRSLLDRLVDRLGRAAVEERGGAAEGLAACGR
jgi:hypothetical protein